MIGRGWVPVLLLLGACDTEGGNKGTEPDTGGDTGETGTIDTTDTGPVYVEGQSPVVLDVSLSVCNPDPDGVDTWYLTVSVTDPQDDVASEGSSVSVLDGEDVLAVYNLACRTEECSVSWQATDDDIDCDVGGDSIFRILVADEAGNVSLPFDHQPD